MINSLKLKSTYLYIQIFNFLILHQGFPNFFFQMAPFNEIKKAMAPLYQDYSKTTIKNT